MFTLVHITDLHLAPLPIPTADEMSFKRRLAYISWTKNRHRIHHPDVIAAIAADIKTVAPDHIAVSGDLTNMALDREFENATRWLEQFGDDSKISVVPGNHDAYRSDYEEAIEKHWSRFTAGDGFPFMREFDDFALICVSSGVKTQPFMANGVVSDEQLAKLEAMLADAADKGLPRVVMIHHPVHSGATKVRKKLTNSREFRAVIDKAGAELILYGHLHKPLRTSIPANGGLAAIRGAGSASASGFDGTRPAHYHVIRVTDKNTFEIEHRAYDPASRAFYKTDTEILPITLNICPN